MKHLWKMLFLTCGLSFLYAGETLSGKITTADGKPLEGIRITDGFQVALSDKDGNYQFARNPKCTYLSVIVPADRDVDPFYKKVSQEQDTNYDFALSSRPKSKEFTFLQFSDHESDYPFLPYLKDIRQRGLAEKAVFVVSTGDLCREKGIQMQAQDMVREKFGGMRTYVTIGNHDLIGEHGSGERFFEEHLCPNRYAFEEGNVLFLVLPMFSGEKRASWTMQELATFVRAILATYPESQQFFILTHFPSPYLNRDEVLFPSLPDLQIPLKNRRFLGMTYGHTHWYNVWNGKNMRLWNTGQSHSGGGGNAPAAYRIFHVKENGDISTELVETNVKPFLNIACNADTGLATAVAFSSGNLVQEIKGTVNGSQVQFKKAGNWLWTASFPPAPGKDIPFSVQASFDGAIKKDTQGTFSNMQNGIRQEAMYVLPGHGLFGTPIVSGDTLFSGIMDDENGQAGAIFAFDTKAGKLLWQTKTGYSIRNTMLLHEGKIYAADCWDTVYVLDAKNGNLLHNWPDTTPEKNFDTNYYGAPVIGDGILFVGCGSSLRAIDLETGNVKWKCNSVPEVFGSTMPLVYRDGKIYIAINWGFLNCLDAQTGKLLWTTKVPKTTFYFQPAFCFLEDGTIFLKNGSKKLDAHDPQTGALLRSGTWEGITERSGSIPLEYQGRLYWGSVDKSLVCADAKSFARLWTAEKTAGNSYLATAQYRSPLKTMESSPILVDGKIVAITGDGVVNVFHPATGERLASFDLGGPALATPVYANGKLFVLDYTGRLFVLKLAL